MSAADANILAMAAAVEALNGSRIRAAYRTAARNVPTPVPKLQITHKFYLIKSGT
jgi:hypothetical protein